MQPSLQSFVIKFVYFLLSPSQVLPVVARVPSVEPPIRHDDKQLKPPTKDWITADLPTYDFPLPIAACICSWPHECFLLDSLSVLGNSTVLSYYAALLACTRSPKLSKKRENSRWLLSPVRDKFSFCEPVFWQIHDMERYLLENPLVTHHTIPTACLFILH